MKFDEFVSRLKEIKIMNMSELTFHRRIDKLADEYRKSNGDETEKVTFN